MTMSKEAFQKENLIFRTVVICAAIVLAALLRIVPHPWNLAPVGAMALFSGAMVDPRRRCNASWRHSVFHRHKFWRLGAREFLSPNLGWSRRLLCGRDSLLLEHSRRRRSLCNPVVRRLRSRRTIHSCAACAQPVRFCIARVAQHSCALINST